MNKHIPVMLYEAIKFLQIQPQNCYVDCTMGYAGHLQAILEQLTNGLVIGIDLDLEACRAASERFKNNKLVQIKHGNFRDIDNLVKHSYHGALLDLGCSTIQLKQADRGFSFNLEGPLDMRFHQNGLTAEQILKTISIRDLQFALKHLSDEKHAHKLSAVIKQSIKKIYTTTDLANLISSNIGWHENKHPATRVFQAIRMLVNQELDNLAIGLPKIFNLLQSDGRLVIITFHSTEDRLVKQFIQRITKSTNGGIFDHVHQTGKYIAKCKPNPSEIKLNPSARSAQMHVISKD